MSLRLKDLSLSGMFKQYSDHSQKYENYASDPNNGSKKATITVVILYLLLVIVLFAIWIWALVAIIKFWDDIPTWAKVVGIIGILPVVPFGSLLSLIVIYASKKKRN